MKFLKSALAAGLVGVFSATSAGAVTLTFDPAVACDNGVVTNCSSAAPDEISNSYGDLPGLLNVSYVSGLKGTSPSTGPVYYWDTGYGTLNHVATGGDPSGGGYGSIIFDVTGATSVTLKSFDIANYAGARSGSTSLWTLKDFLTGTVYDSGSFSGTDLTTQSISLNGGTGYTSAQGFVLEWLNDAEYTSYIGVDNVQYSVTSASAVPEASNLAMLLAGLGVVGAVSRRRQRKAA